MGAAFVLSSLVFTALMVIFTIAVVGLLFKIVLRIVLLPLLLIKWFVMGIVGVVLFLTFGLLLLLPLLPFAVLGGLIWLLVRATRRPAVA